MAAHIIRDVPAAILSRRAIERHIAALIDLLDEIDGDVADLEPDNDAEPTLGWGTSGSIMSGYQLGDGELEPTLGWGAGSQGSLHTERHDGEIETTALETAGHGFHRRTGPDDAEPSFGVL